MRAEMTSPGPAPTNAASSGVTLDRKTLKAIAGRADGPGLEEVVQLREEGRPHMWQFLLHFQRSDPCIRFRPHQLPLADTLSDLQPSAVSLNNPSSDCYVSLQ